MIHFLRIGQKMNEVVDTNVILRFLVGDNASQRKKAENYFKEAEQGKRTLIIKPLVVAECCFVLESFYKRDRDEIASAFETFLSQKWLKVEDRKAMISMWKYYRENLHFVDSYLLSWAKSNKAEILSFDKQLMKRVK